MHATKVGDIWVDLDDLKGCVDLRDILKEEYVCCPWHDDTHPSMYVYPDHVHCYACDATADSITMVQKWFDIDFRTAVRLLLRYKRSSRIQQVVITEPVDMAVVRQEHNTLMSFSPRTDVWRWLHEERGLERRIVQALTLGWTGRAYSIPFFENGVVMNVKYRKHPKQGGDLKYWAMKGRKFTYPYPWDHFRKTYADEKKVFITEGEFDAMVLLQCGLPALSLPSGVDTSWFPWVPFLRQFSHIYALYDRDEAGWRGLDKLFMDKGKLGKTVAGVLHPTQILYYEEDEWPSTWGKDVTEARQLLIPLLRRECEQDI